MAQSRSFLGAAVDLGFVLPAGVVFIKPKDISRQAVVLDLQEALATGHMTAGQASKTRGRSNWVATNAFGKVGRLGTSVLRDIQYHPLPGNRLSLVQLSHLHFHLQVIERVRGRALDIIGIRDAPWVVYSDAEFTPGQVPRIGGIVFPPGADQTPIGLTSLIPEGQQATWRQRRHQIYLCELAAVPVVLAKYSHLFLHQDILFFLDNDASVASLVRAGSAEPDAEYVAQLVHCLLIRLHARAWFDWVDTKSNPADGLSRQGLQDPRAVSGQWRCEELQSWYVWGKESNPWADAAALLQHWAAPAPRPLLGPVPTPPASVHVPEPGGQRRT